MFDFDKLLESIDFNGSEEIDPRPTMVSYEDIIHIALRTLEAVKKKGPRTIRILVSAGEFVPENTVCCSFDYEDKWDEWY